MNSLTWGTDAAERARTFPCDGVLPGAEAAYFRGVTVNAPAATVYRWLCQLRAAPYSYDWIDNFGRQSPPQLIAGLDDLVVGQRVMTIFDLVSFEPGRHLTIKSRPGSGWRWVDRHSPQVAVSYLVEPAGDGRCRLLAKLLVDYPPGVWGALLRRALPWGDLIMMRRQLLNLKALAERE